MTTLSPFNIKALQALTTAFKSDLAQHISTDDRFIQLMMDMALDYVDDHIGLTDEEATHELAMMLFDSLTLKPE